MWSMMEVGWNWDEMWAAKAGGGGCVTAFVVFFLLFWHLFRVSSPKQQQQQQQRRKQQEEDEEEPACSLTPTATSSSLDLRDLIHDLHEQGHGEEWKDVLRKNNHLVSYYVKCCRQKDGSLKYFSVTTFEECSTELLRDFYMDNEYRKKWDKTVVGHEQLQFDDVNMIEFGRTIKKFPFLTPREYVLAWRLWEGKHKTFYCFIKDCEHPLAPRQKKYVRVGFFRSGWRISKVPGRNACEITMVHQEDAGLNIEMAKLAFAKGIWSYVCKMNNALREYSSWSSMDSKPVTLLKAVQVPPGLESYDKSSSDDTGVRSGGRKEDLQERFSLGKSPSKKWIAKGLLVVGGVVCLSRGHSTLATQLAMACFLKKITRTGQEESNHRESSGEVPRGRRWARPGHCSWSQKSKSVGNDLLSSNHLRSVH